MITAKEAVRELLDRLPDDVSFEKIFYEIYVVERIVAGLHDIEQARVIPHEEVEREREEKLCSAELTDE